MLRRARRFLSSGLCAALLLGASTAPLYAAEPPLDDGQVAEVERLAEDARRFYKAKQYAKAVAAYVKAYQLRKEAALLYNIAFIYDKKLGEADLAIDYYRQYVKAADAEPDVVEKTLARLEELKQLQKTIVEKPPPDTGKGPKNGAGGQTVHRVGAVKTSSGMQTAGVATLVSGGVLLVAGGALAIAAFDKQSSFESSIDLNEKKGLRADGQTFALVGDIMLGVGAAATITGIVLMAVAPSGPAADGGSVKVETAVRPGGAMVLLSGTL